MSRKRSCTTSLLRNRNDTKRLANAEKVTGKKTLDSCVLKYILLLRLVDGEYFCNLNILQVILAFKASGFDSPSQSHPGGFLYFQGVLDMRTRKDVTGQRFGRLTAINFVKSNSNHDSYWLFKCDCGTMKVIRLGHCKPGDIQSCGCKNREINKLRHINSESVVGRKRNRLWQTWRDMRARCRSNSRHSDYAIRGIKVCEEWQKYLPFKKWALENGYDPTLTIDRINNDGNYEPSNCRWATHKQQNRNKRNNCNLTFNGKTMCIADWADYLGLSYSCLYGRIKSGYGISELITMV